MVTGCSTADVAVILVDARRGLVEQSRRHACIAALLGVRRLVLCVNKMDLVGHDETVFRRIAAEFSDWALGLGVAHVTVIPTSALHGGNVVTPWSDTPWYDGPTLLEHLETVPLTADAPGAARFPVQLVIRPRDERVLGLPRLRGRVAGGVLRPGDEVVVLPSGVRSRIARLDTFDGPLDEAGPGRSVTVLLEDDVDVSRGDLLCDPEDAPVGTSSFDATVCWLAERPLEPGGRYLLKHTTRTVRALVDDVRLRLDVNTLEPDASATTIGLNDIGRLRLRVAEPLHLDRYRANRRTGSFVLIDEASNETVGAGPRRGRGVT
jgi:bifunctional enzyme CysN/CysC